MSQEVINISLKNCKNILVGKISITKGILNVKFAQNGTGKSTIGEALKYHFENDKLNFNNLKSFSSKEKPIISFCIKREDGSEEKCKNPFSKVIIFDDDFVKNTVFSENQAILNSFDVFIRSSEYLQKKDAVDKRLHSLRIDIQEKPEINSMKRVFDLIMAKISFNKDGKLAKRGLIKDVIQETNVYKLPTELKKYKDFFEGDKRVDWVGWKSEGFKFDNKNKCPFCATDLNIEQYKVEKLKFEESYNKNLVKNQKELEDYLTTLEPFMNRTEYLRFIGFTRDVKNIEDFNFEMKRFVEEINHVHTKISNIIGFSAYEFESKEIAMLEKLLKELMIDSKSFKIFNGEKAMLVFELINKKIQALLLEISYLKGEIIQLNNFVKNAIDESSEDINDFLRTAGIEYEFRIIRISDDYSQARLFYNGVPSEDMGNVDIRKCLSWGEKNAIALVLFIYYAISKEADLIILDDPISSFDKSKKYAIIHRLFKSGKKAKTLLNKTVLMLSHDFEPLIDLKVADRFSCGLANANYLTNPKGELCEKNIDPFNHIKSITAMYLRDAKNGSLNIYSRITSLRKYYEYIDSDFANSPSYHILSSIMKGREKATYKSDSSGNQEILPKEEFDKGIAKIKETIQDFDYEKLHEENFIRAKIVEAFNNETNNFFRLQIFRNLFILENDSIVVEDDVLEKFANESFHIENDYSHFLDYSEFDIVPPFVTKRIVEYMKNIV